MDSPDPPLDRLTDEEIHFVRPGNSPEIEAWNREYASLVEEYLSGLEQQDEGFAGERLAEIRKSRGGWLRKEASLVDAARQEVRHRRLEDRER